MYICVNNTNLTNNHTNLAVLSFVLYFSVLYFKHSQKLIYFYHDVIPSSFVLSFDGEISGSSGVSQSVVP